MLFLKTKKTWINILITNLFTICNLIARHNISYLISFMSPYFLHLNNYKIQMLSCFVSFFASCSIVGSLLHLLGALYP